MVLTVSFALFPETGFVVSVAGIDALASPPTWRQHRDARTTRLCRPRGAHSSDARSRPSHPALNVRDDRETPLLRGGTFDSIELLLADGEAKYFSQEGWTGDANHSAKKAANSQAKAEGTDELRKSTLRRQLSICVLNELFIRAAPVP
jgi:hypothetical protein